MAKQVQLSDAAYRLLKARKRGDESFSDVVLRLARPRGDPMALFGAKLLEPSFDLAEFREESGAVDAARAERVERRRRRGRA
jgi:predicted CopG family antitoxin